MNTANQNTAARQFSTFECIKGLFYLYCALFNDIIVRVSKKVGWWWRLISTREDRLLAKIPSSEFKLKTKIDGGYALWCRVGVGY